MNNNLEDKFLTWISEQEIKIMQNMQDNNSEYERGIAMGKLLILVNLTDFLMKEPILSTPSTTSTKK